jgi:hypothetical protein
MGQTAHNYWRADRAQGNPAQNFQGFDLEPNEFGILAADPLIPARSIYCLKAKDHTFFSFFIFQLANRRIVGVRRKLPHLLFHSWSFAILQDNAWIQA